MDPKVYALDGLLNVIGGQGSSPGKGTASIVDMKPYVPLVLVDLRKTRIAEKSTPFETSCPAVLRERADKTLQMNTNVMPQIKFGEFAVEMSAREIAEKTRQDQWIRIASATVRLCNNWGYGVPAKKAEYNDKSLPREEHLATTTRFEVSKQRSSNSRVVRWQCSLGLGPYPKHARRVKLHQPLSIREGLRGSICKVCGRPKQSRERSC
jgi:hypothetical protein